MWDRQTTIQACAAVCGALALSATSSAAAGVITATYTGLISDAPRLGGFYGQVGVDYYGLFSDPGTNLVGNAFSVVYTTDESTPGAMPFFALDNYSGISYATTAVLTINGHSFSLNNSAASFRVAFTNSPQYGGWGTADLATAGAGEYQYGAFARLSSATDHVVPSYLYNVPFSHVAQLEDQGVGDFYVYYPSLNGHYVEDLAFSVSAVTVTVEGPVIQPPPPPPPVPEPSMWAMMLFGLGGLGAALRTRRRRSELAKR